MRQLAAKEAWTITFEYLGNNPTSADPGQAPSNGKGFSAEILPQQVRVTSMSPYLSLRIQGEKPRDRIAYFIANDLVYSESPARPVPTRMIIEGGGGSEETSLQEQILFATMGKQFFGFEWITAGTYIGVEAVGGTRCLVFQKDDATAWVDLVKRQPVLWKKGAETRYFVKNSDPTSNDIPENLMQRIRDRNKDLEALKKPVLRGG